MQWNSINVSAACLVLGFAGFLAGRPAGVPERGGGDGESSVRVTVEPRPSQDGRRDNGFGSNLRREIRLSKNGSKGAPATLEGRLAKMEKIVSAFPDDGTHDRQDCIRAISAWVDSLPVADIPAALARLDESFGKMRGVQMGGTSTTMVEMVVAKWAKSDPRAALDYACSDTAFLGKICADKVILPTWAASDPEAAISWVMERYNQAVKSGRGDKLFGGAPGFKGMNGIIRTLADTDPARATELIHAMATTKPLPNSTNRWTRDWDTEQAITEMAPSLMRQGPDAAASWVSEIPDVSFRTDALNVLALEMGRSAPEKAASWLVSNMSLGDGGEEFYEESIRFFKGWKVRDKRAATAFCAELPDGEFRTKLLEGVPDLRPPVAE